MPPRLDQHALARVDQDHGQVRRARPGDHVAGILFVSGTIRDDELALLGIEEAIGDVDGNALFALCRKPVNQQGKVNFLPLGALLLAVIFQRGKLILEDHLGIVEQPPDQGRLAIVHAAAGDEAQHGLALVRLKISVDIFGNQRVGDVDGVAHFRNSPAASSLPSRLRQRPCRSPGPAVPTW